MRSVKLIPTFTHSSLPANSAIFCNFGKFSLVVSCTKTSAISLLKPYLSKPVDFKAAFVNTTLCVALSNPLFPCLLEIASVFEEQFQNIFLLALVLQYYLILLDVLEEKVLDQ